MDDRIDLEDQITGDFTRAEIPNIDSISSKQELEEKIQSGNSPFGLRIQLLDITIRQYVGPGM